MDDFKKMVLGDAGTKRSVNPFKGKGGKKKVAKKSPKRRRKGNWDMMYGGQEEEEKKKGKKSGNFRVDTTTWF